MLSQVVSSLLLLAVCASCSSSQGSQLPLLQGLLDELAKEFPDEAADTLKKVLGQALDVAAAQEVVPKQDLTCERNYRTLCPQRWVDAGDGETCLAPIDYAGPCSKFIKYGNMTPAAKSQRALECGTEFTCIGEAPQDAAKTCPMSWNEDLDHSCVAPADYMGPCVGRKSFAGFSTEEKASWGRSCGVSWPARKTLEELRSKRAEARQSCLKDYSFPCPEGWMSDGHHCSSPSAYEGQCGTAVRTTLSLAQKKALEKVCTAPWPCKQKYVASGLR